jgi:hypothetical protein
MNLQTNKTIIVDSFFSLEDQQIFKKEYVRYMWELTGTSIADVTDQKFWNKELINTPLLNLFQSKIEKGINKKIKMHLLYANGQSHSQCGTWHTDTLDNSTNYFTLVYFPKPWLPEYGGHLMIKEEDEILSILPKFNKGVIFESKLSHMGLEPSKHCFDIRESIACKFEVLV